MSQGETTEPIIDGQRVRVSGESVRVGAPAPHAGHGPHAEPKIQLVREDGVIRAIDITCGCGEKIRIRCEYP